MFLNACPVAHIFLTCSSEAYNLNLSGLCDVRRGDLQQQVKFLLCESALISNILRYTRKKNIVILKRFQNTERSLGCFFCLFLSFIQIAHFIVK